jgi:F-type H+-transporting ATPase subunit a
MVSFAAEPIFTLGSFRFTNTLLDTLIIDAILIALCVSVGKNIKLIPGKVQNGIEYVIEGLYGLTESVAFDRTAKIFPYFMSFFLFILLVNWSGLIPGVGTIGFIQ